MKWVTREHVHLDRVASPWLIKRFVDPEATFVYVQWGQEHLAPADATPLAMGDGPLSGHDASGTTYAKILRHYQISDPAAVRIGRIIDLGVAYVLNGWRPEGEDEDGQVAVGLLALAEGMMLTRSDDDAILETSFTLYDALYARYRVLEVMDERAIKMPMGEDGRGPSAQFELMRGLQAEMAS